MAKNALIQVRIDEELKSQAESVYERLGTSLSEAVRIFAAQSVAVAGFPFVPRSPAQSGAHMRGTLSFLADPRKRELESSAFAAAMKEKHGHTH